jgi:hypothetical protein
MGESKLRFDEPDDVNLGPSHVVVHVVIRGLQTARNRLNRMPDVANRSQNPRKRSRWTKPRRFRDREAPGSNPGPPTILYSKSAISVVGWSQRNTAVSQFPAEQRNRGRGTLSVARQCRDHATGIVESAAPQTSGRTGQDREAPDSVPVPDQARQRISRPQGSALPIEIHLTSFGV